MFFTKAGPGSQLELLLRSRIDRARELAGRGDRGASAIEWVIITGVLIIIVGAVALIISNKLKQAATSLDPTPKLGP